MEKSFAFNTQSKQYINIFNSSDAIVQYSHKNKNRMKFHSSSKQLRNRKTQNTSLAMDGTKRHYQTKKRGKDSGQFRPRFHQAQPQPQPQPQLQTQTQTQVQPQPQPQAQAQNGNNYITRRELEEVLNKFKDELKTKLTEELKTEIDKLKTDLTRMIGHVYEVALAPQLPSIIQNFWNLVPVHDGSYCLYRRNETNENSFVSLENNLNNRPELAILGEKSLENIQEIEINFLQPYQQKNKTLKFIDMSPTKQKPLNDILINTLVIAEATVSTLGFEDGSDSKKVWLIKLSQLETQIEFLKVHYDITNIAQFRVLLVSPSLKGVEWTTKLRELLEEHDQTFQNLHQLFEKDFFVMIGV